MRIQEFLDMIAPSNIKFQTDHFIYGNTYRCVWALREYPTAVEYVRNFSKRVRKKDSAVIIALQNLEDFNIDGIRQYTKHSYLYKIW